MSFGKTYECCITDFRHVELTCTFKHIKNAIYYLTIFLGIFVAIQFVTNVWQRSVKITRNSVSLLLVSFKIFCIKNKDMNCLTV